MNKNNNDNSNNNNENENDSQMSDKQLSFIKLPHRDTESNKFKKLLNHSRQLYIDLYQITWNQK